MSRSVAFYAILLGVSACLMAAVLHFGVSVHPTSGMISPGGSAKVEGLFTPLAQTLLQVIVIIVAARLVGRLFTKIGQPAVVGEMAVGLALGPSLLGAVAPSLQRFVFPSTSLPTLSMLSQVGVVLFMFAVGMDVDVKLLRKRADSAILISHMSIVVPFLLGTGSAIWLYADYAAGKPFLPFALFMGISMSITAFPVLARIIQERGLAGTMIGNTAITCAAIDDVTAWSGLALIVAIAQSRGVMSAAITVVAAILFFLVVLLGLRPLLQRIADRLPDASNPDAGMTVAVLVIVFGCALTTEAIGIHALFGAFVAGIAMPKSEEFRRFFRERLESLSSLFLLPVFFAFTGLRTQIGLLSSPTDWAVCAGLLAIAVFGKFGGTVFASRLAGLNWRESAAMGALMNTRGLVELIVLNLGLDLGVLEPKVFAMLVLMALITTLTTGPAIGKLGYGLARSAEGGRARDPAIDVCGGT